MSNRSHSLPLRFKMYKKAYRFDDQTVFYFDAYDNKSVAKGGSLAWRLNNPGLLHAHDPIVRKRNKIGSQFPYIIFSTPTDGMNALYEWLKSPKFFNAPLLAIAQYHQPEHPEEYLERLCLASKLAPDIKLNALSPEEFRHLTKAIQTICGFSSSQEGELALLPKISARYYSSNANKVEYYLVGFDILLTKTEAITWVKSHRLDAVIVHKSDGIIYLRSRPGHHLNQIHLTDQECGPEIEFKNAVRDVGVKKDGQYIWGYINGVWNSDECAKDSTTFISQAVDGEQVWSLMNNTKSTMGDLVECIHQKLDIDTDIVKFAAKFLQLLLSLSEEDPKKPPVIVFVHSQGAIIADLALNLLSAAECKKIRIFTFGGGAFIFPNKSHSESHNYISTADGVPRLASFKLTALALRRNEGLKKGLTQEQVIDNLVIEDADYYLDTININNIPVYSEQRRNFYKGEFEKIANLTVLEQSKDAFLGYWEHSFEVPCYQNMLKETIKRYQDAAN